MFFQLCVSPGLCQADRSLFALHCRIHDRENYTRATSDDLFISELWRLLDDYEVFKPQTFSYIHWPGVKKA